MTNGTEERPRTIRTLLKVAAQWLTERGVEGADLDTQLLLAHTLGCRRLDLFMDHDRSLQDQELARFRALMRRRGDDREPVAYIVGKRSFRLLELAVTPDVLVPRPETEELVDIVLAEVDRLTPGRSRALRFADVGTGSGCIGLSLVSERPALRGVLVDISAPALSVARSNAAALGLLERIGLVRASLLRPFADGSLDLVVSNPPYVGEDERHLLAPEVAAHEPALALFDAPGLPLTRDLATQAARALAPGGVLAVETGHTSAELVEGLFLAAGLTEVRRVRDLAGIERVVVGARPQE